MSNVVQARSLGVDPFGCRQDGESIYSPPGCFAVVALRDDGKVVAWGDTNVQSYDHAFKLRYSGTDKMINDLPCSVAYGAVNCTGPNQLVVQVEVGNNWAAARTDSGQIVAWGDDQFQQVSGAPTVSTVTQIALGARHGLALLQDGSVVAWGDNQVLQASVPPLPGPVAHVAAAGDVSIAVTSDGQLVCWGGALSFFCPQPSDLGNVPVKHVAISAGMSGLAYLGNGSLVWWRQSLKPLGRKLLTRGVYQPFTIIPTSVSAPNVTSQSMPMRAYDVPYTPNATPDEAFGVVDVQAQQAGPLTMWGLFCNAYPNYWDTPVAALDFWASEENTVVVCDNQDKVCLQANACYAPYYGMPFSAYPALAA